MTLTEQFAMNETIKGKAKAYDDLMQMNRDKQIGEYGYAKGLSDIMAAEAYARQVQERQALENLRQRQLEGYQPEYTGSVDSQVAMAPGLAATLRQGGSR